MSSEQQQIPTERQRDSSNYEDSGKANQATNLSQANANKELSTIELSAGQETRHDEQTLSDLSEPRTVDGNTGQPMSHYGIFRRHMRFDPLSIVFALLVFAGGIVGYVVKNSTASLVAGTIFALLLGATTYIEGARRNPYPLMVTLLALGSMMLYRLIISDDPKFMPSGLVALLAFIMLARHAYLLYLRLWPTSTQ